MADDLEMAHLTPTGTLEAGCCDTIGSVEDREGRSVERMTGGQVGSLAHGGQWSSSRRNETLSEEIRRGTRSSDLASVIAS